MRHLVAASCIVSAVVCMPASAATTYNLSRCASVGNGVSLKFESTEQRVRRMHLGPNGVELSGDIKGYARLDAVREMKLQPKLAISYVTGPNVEFGKLTHQCAEKIRAAAKVLSVKVRSSDG
jgi:hypothetical protein